MRGAIRTGKWALLAAGLALLAALAAAAPASAIIVKLKSGRYLSYQALTGKSPRPLLRRPHDAAFSNLDYSGGPVMPSNVNYVVDWLPSNCVQAGCTHLGSGTTGFAYGVAQYFKDLQAASGSTTNSDSISTQYNDAQGDTAAYNSQFGGGGAGPNGVLVDSDPILNNGCSEGTFCITDDQLQTELETFVAANHLPVDLTHEYFVLTPPIVVTCFDAAGTACSGNAFDQRSQFFCGYHSGTATSSPILYANIPDLDQVVGCDPFVTTGACLPSAFGGAGIACSYNGGSEAQGVLSTVAHEHNESITDPLPNTAWTDFQPGCTSTSPETCGGEVGDKCSGDEDLSPTNQYQLGLHGAGTAEPFNETIGGHPYWLQMEWSNQGAGCFGSLNQLPGGGLQTPPGASFTVTGNQSVANTDTFNATGSGGGIAEYVWQFNDDPNNIQNTTVETTSPTVTHTFPAAGTYNVALTTMAANGRSMGTVTQIVAAGLSHAAFAVTTPAAIEGAPVGFSAAGTSHDAAVGISSYSWNFGDGSAPGSGVTTAHNFTAGAHTVTLTVTDTLGRVSTASQIVTVADRPPVVSFKAPSGRAGAKLSFTGHAADDEGIAKYLWRFGDGGSAVGRSVKHAYRHKGRFTVTLTAVDAAGKSASVSHTVSVSASKPKRKRRH